MTWELRLVLHGRVLLQSLMGGFYLRPLTPLRSLHSYAREEFISLIAAAVKPPIKDTIEITFEQIGQGSIYQIAIVLIYS